MTTINASSLSSYSTRFTVAVKKDATAEVADSDASTTTDATSASASITATAAGGAGGAGGASDSSSTSEQAIAKLEEQIKETQKRLQEQQQQLAATQASSGTDEEKSARVMAIQGQISSSTASLATEQAALLQLQKSGSINTTA
jgi:hypothetical protein